MKRLLLILVIGFGVVAVGCGDDSGGGGASSDPGEAGAVATADAAFTALFESQNAEAAYRLMSPACREVMSFGDFAGEMTFGMALLLGFMGIEPDRQSDITIENVRAVSVTDGVEAQITFAMMLDDLELGDSANDDPARFVYEDGQWWATCDDFDAYQRANAVPCDDLQGTAVDDIDMEDGISCLDGEDLTTMFFSSYDCSDGSTLIQTFDNQWFGNPGGTLTKDQAAGDAAWEACYS
ncbi:MAG: hypothetical protein R8F63_10610 [Acidimicrobiales bacterium]|nr:hypothetical protein [Acidimicrobiales bacterium]